MRLILYEGAQIAASQRVTKLSERLGLDLADALTGHRKALAHFLQGVLSLFADTET